MRNRIPDILNLTFFIISLLLNLLIKLDPPVWIGYGDPYDYLKQSQESYTSIKLYAPEKTVGFNPRPFTVPLFYKFADSNPERIILMQKLVHALATLFLCFVLLLFFEKIFTKVVFIIFWYLLMSWWNIMGWTNTLLSESLLLSFMFLWIASFLLFLHYRNVLTIIIHIFITILFSFTRDSWPYILITFYSMVIIIFIIFNKERKLMLGGTFLLLLSVSIFYIQQKTAKIGQRYTIPIVNNIVFRVLPNDKYLDWFSERGMPGIDKLKEKYGNLSYWKDVYPLYTDTLFADFSEWAANEGKSLYIKFLISHPENIFLYSENLEKISKIFSYNIGYTGGVSGFSKASEHFFPVFNGLTIIILNFILIFLYIKERRIILLFPTVLILIFSFNAVLLYIADTLEVERHLLVTKIMIQFVGILVMILIIDSKYLLGFVKKLSVKTGMIINK